MMESSVQRILKYCSSIAVEFESRLSRIREFIPDHNLTAGTANEMILRDFLSRLSTGSHKVSQGFICDITDSDLVSKQCDIIVHDVHSYPLIYSDGEIEVVFPESVKILIEVKTTLDKAKLGDALENIRIAKKMGPFVNGIIFAFQSPHLNTVIKHLQEYVRDIPIEHAPVAILLFNKGIIIHLLGKWGSASIANMMRRLLEENTLKREENIKIGNQLKD